MRLFYRPCHARCHNRLIATCCNADGSYAVNCQIHANANDAAGWRDVANVSFLPQRGEHAVALYMALRVGKLELTQQRWPALRLQGVHHAEVRSAHDDQDD